MTLERQKINRTEVAIPLRTDAHGAGAPHPANLHPDGGEEGFSTDETGSPLSPFMQSAEKLRVRYAEAWRALAK